MRNTKSLGLTLMLAALLAGCGDKGGSVASSGTSAAPDKEAAVTLRLNPKEGEKFVYDSSMKMQIVNQGQPMGVDMNFKTTREISKSEGGKITIKESASDVEVKGSGMMESMGPELKKTLESQVSTKVYDQRNKIVQDGAASASAAGGDFSAVFPEKAIKAGDTWEDTITNQGATMKVNFKAEGVETVEGKEAMKITMDFAPDNQFKFKGPLTFWVETSNGMPVKAQGKLTGEQQGGKLTIDIDMKRVS